MEKLVEYQAGLAAFAAETPYDTYLLDTDEDDGNVLRALSGVVGVQRNAAPSGHLHE